MSFDTAITTRRHDLLLESGAYGESLLEAGQWLMEIKTAQAIPIWLTRILSEYKIYPRSYSKYGAEYQATLVSRPQQQAVSVCFPASVFAEIPVALASGE